MDTDGGIVMSFGKRKKAPAGGAWRAATKDIHEVRLERGAKRLTLTNSPAREKDTEKEGSFSLLEGAMILCLVGAATYVGYLALPRPLLATPTKTYTYTGVDLLAMMGGMSGIQKKAFQVNVAIHKKGPARHNEASEWQSREELKKMPDRYVVRIADIVLPPRNAVRAARMHGKSCDATPMPEIVSVQNAKKWFQPVTNYLACALRLDQRRLCDPAERRKLAHQLMTYSRMHQKIVGYLRYVGYVNRNNPLREVFDMLAERIESLSPSKGRRKRKKQTVISPNLPPEIVSGLRSLVRQGYITPYEFSWSGLSVPAEFMPAFEGWRPVSPPCGGGTKA